jgi:hypothetical protein
MCSQVLRSAVHNYPSCTNMIWDKIQDNVLDLLQIENFEDQKYDANIGPPGPKEEPSIKTRCLVAGIKVMSYINIFYSCSMKNELLYNNNNQAFYFQTSWGRLEMKPHESKKRQNKSEKEGGKQMVIKTKSKRRKGNKTLS